MSHCCHYALCTHAATLRCTRCKQVYYCGRDHQKADWATHKLTCAPPAHPPQPSQPQQPQQPSNIPSSASALLPPLSNSHSIQSTSTLSPGNPNSSRFPLAEVPRNIVATLDEKIVRSVAGYLRSADNTESNLMIVLPGANDTPMLRESPVFTMSSQSSSSSHTTSTVPPAANTDESRYFRTFQQMALPQCSALFLSPFHIHKPFLSLGITLRQFFPCFAADGTRIAGKAADIPTKHARVLGLWEGGLALILLIRVLVRYCNWPLDRIFLVGYGDGGVLAVHTAAYLATYLKLVHLPVDRLAGVYAFDGCLMGEMEDIWSGNSNIPASLPSTSSSSSSSSSSPTAKSLPLSQLKHASPITTPIFLAAQRETATITAQQPLLQARAAAGGSPTVYQRKVFSVGAGSGLETSEKDEGEMIVMQTYKDGNGIFGSQAQVKDFMNFYAQKGYFRDLGLEQSPDTVQIH